MVIIFPEADMAVVTIGLLGWIIVGNDEENTRGHANLLKPFDSELSARQTHQQSASETIYASIHQQIRNLTNIYV